MRFFGWISCVILLFCLNSHAKNWTVRLDGLGDFTNIQDAAIYSADNDHIVIEPGIYTGYGNHNISLYRKKITIRSVQPNNSAIVAATIIDCQHNDRAFIIADQETHETIISGITIINGASDDGGAIYCDNSNPTITGCVFTNCNASNWGGAIFLKDSSAIIQKCKFSGNYAFEGAAISINCWSLGFTPLIEDCTITYNKAEGSGGGINCDWNSTPTISRCTITGNIARQYGGGGISSFVSNPRIQNCIIAGNKTENSGGGVLCWYKFNGNDTGPIISNCTITSNSADNSGGGIYIDRKCEATLNNCIIWDNNATLSGNQIALLDDGTYGKSSIDIEYCNIQNGQANIPVDPWCSLSWGDGNIDTYPSFVRLPNHGGDGWRIGGNDDYGNLHLLSTSKCIGKGKPGSYPGQTDIDGEVRAAGNIDIGADEAYTINGDLSNDGIINLSDLAILASQWLASEK